MNRNRYLRGRNAASGVLSIIPGLNPVAWFLANIGITQSGGFCSKWADQSGRGNDLIQNTAGQQPAANADGSLTFDGISHWLQASFTYNQPLTTYAVFTQISWTSNDTLIDGVVQNMKFVQLSASPNLAGGVVGNFVPAAGDATITLSTKGIACLVANGASSVFQLAIGGASSTNSGNVGANNPAGLTICSGRTGSNFGNATMFEVACFATNHNSTTRLIVMNDMGARYGIPVST